MAKKKTKKSVDDGEQQDIPGSRKYIAKCEKPVSSYLNALAQRMLWQAEENNARPIAMDAMRAADVREYYLKTGAKLEREDKGEKLKATFPKDDDGAAEKPERQMHIEVVD